MRPTCLFALFVLSVAGCKTCSSEEEGCAHGAACRENIVVKVPKQTVEVEAPAPQATGAPIGSTPQPLGLAPMSQGIGYPMGPIGGTGMPIGAPTIRERTGLGLVFDHFNIPIPFPRLIAVPKPSEVTFHVPPTGYAPTGFGMPMGMPMGMPIATGMVAPAGFGMVPQAPAPQAQGLSLQQQALLLQMLANQGTGTGTPPPPAPTGSTPPPAATTATVVTDQQCEEIIQKCNILKRLHQLRQHACDAATCPPK